MYQSEAGTLPVTTGHRNHPGITHTPNSLGHRRSACHRINRYRLGVLGTVWSLGHPRVGPPSVVIVGLSSSALTARAGLGLGTSVTLSPGLKVATASLSI